PWRTPAGAPAAVSDHGVLPVPARPGAARLDRVPRPRARPAGGPARRRAPRAHLRLDHPRPGVPASGQGIALPDRDPRTRRTRGTPGRRPRRAAVRLAPGQLRGDAGAVAPPP